MSKKDTLLDLVTLLISQSNGMYIFSFFSRVNLIGEHIDYCGYSVLPMAIQQSIHAAFRHIPESSLLSLRNTASEYGNFELDLTKIV